MTRTKPTGERTNLIAAARAPGNRGFVLAPILYMLALIGVGAGVLFSSYSQILRSNQNISNTLTAKNDLQGTATTLAATSWISTDGEALCPPIVGSHSPQAPATRCSSSVSASTIGAAFGSAVSANLPTGYASVSSAGSPVEVGVFAAGHGEKVLDPWGHYYIYCRWENGIGGYSAFAVISAGPNGTLETNCGASSPSGDDLMVTWTTAVTQNRASVWQTTSVGSTITGTNFGSTGSQVSIGTGGNVSIPNTLNVSGLTTLGTATAGVFSAAEINNTPITGSTGQFTWLSDTVSFTSGGAGQFAIDASGNVTTSGNITTTGSGQLTVAGTSSLSSAAVSGTLGVTGAATLGSTSVTGFTNTGTSWLGGALKTSTAAINIGTTVSTGTAQVFFSVGTARATNPVTYPFYVDQFGDVVGSTYTGNLYGNVTGNITGNLSNGSVSATSFTDSGSFSVTSTSTATFAGAISATSYLGTFNIGGGGGLTLSGVLPIGNGGTGEPTAATALSNLFSLAGTNAGMIPAADINCCLASAQMTATGITAGVPYSSVIMDAAGRVTGGTQSTYPIEIIDGNGDSVSVGTTTGIVFAIGSSMVGNWTGSGLMVGSSKPAVNKLDVYGAQAIGTGYAGVYTAPTNGLIVQGNAAIGTSNPMGYALNVNGTVSAASFVGNGSGLTGIGSGIVNPGTTGEVAYYPGNGTTVVGTSTMIITNGNVGIGTTAPRFTEEVNGQIMITGAYNQLSNLGWYDIGAGTIGARTSLYSYGSICTGNSIGDCTGSWGVVIGSANASATNNIPNSGNVFFTSGNVGIGTTSPQSKLSVQAGEVQVGSSSASCALNNQGAIRYAAGTLYYCDNASTWESIDSSGSASGGDYIEVTTTAPNPTGTMQGYLGASAALGAIVSGQGSTADVTLMNKAGTAALEVLDNTTNLYMPGNVGIGTTTPGVPLTVESTNAAGLQLQTASTNQWEAIYFAENNGTGRIAIQKGPANDLEFWTNSGSWTQQMTITANGNVGIGTTAPYAALDVSGTVRASGTNVTQEIQLLDQAANSTVWNLGIGDTAGSYFSIGDGSSNSNRFVIKKTTGNVGIGSSNPGVALDVSGTARATLFSGSGASLTSIGTSNMTGVTGTATSSTFLRGDNTWATPSVGTSQITGVLPVANGGTGDSALTSHGVLIGENTSNVNVTAAGSGGQLLIGQAGADPSFQTMSQDVTITSGGVTTVGKIQNVSVGSPTGTAGSAVVLAASPSLTTPSITGATLSGTISGGTFSSGTWQGGTIGISYGGTNATSQTSNGIAYYNGSSITTSSNLVYNGGNVGIGTTAPNTLLHTVGGSIQFDLLNSGNNNIIIRNGASTLSSLITDSSGGTAVYNGLALLSNANWVNSTYGQANATLPSWFIDLGGRAADGNSFQTNTADQFRIGRVAAGGTFLNTNASFIINNSGQVGVGTAFPQSLVQAYRGEVQVGSSGGSCAANTQGAIRYAGGVLYYCDNASTWESLDSSGTAGSSDYIEVTSTAPNPSGTSQGYLGANATLGAIVSGQGSASDVTLENKSGTPALEILDNTTNLYMPGNVGIGTSSPQVLLDVNGAIWSRGAFTLSQKSTQEIRWQPASTNGAAWRAISTINGSANGYLVFQNTTDGFNTVFTNSVALGTNGNVGVGTVSPQSLVQAYGGEVQVGSSGASCAGANQGAIRYAGGTLYYCDNASTWESLDSSGTAGSSDYIEVTSTAPNPSATSQGYLGASATLGAILSGQGTTADVTLQNKAGTPAFEVLDNTTNLYMPGNVGIGTTLPAATLDVNGVINAATGFRGGNTATSGNYLRGNGTNFVSSAIQAADVPILNQNTTGIATYANYINSNDTRAVNDQPQAFGNLIKFDFKQNSTNGLSDGGTYNGVMTWRKYGSGSDFTGGPALQLAYTDNGNLWTRLSTSATAWGTWYQLLNSTSGVLLQASTPGTQQTGNMNISGTGIFGGNVGIGTTSPVSNLQVRGTSSNTMTVDDTGNSIIVFARNEITKAMIGVSNGSGVLTGDSVTNDLVVRSQSGHILFNDNSGTGNSTMAIYNGSVGIGTPTPGYTLDVSGTLRSTGSAYLGTGNGYAQVGNYSATALSALTLAGYRPGTWSANTLAFGDELNAGRYFMNTRGTNENSNADWDFYYYNTASGGAWQRLITVNPTALNAATYTESFHDDALYINSSGNVGIGMTPSYPLDVNGTARATLFSGSGASLNSLAVSNLSGVSGTPSSSNFLRGDNTWATPVPTFSGLTNTDFCTASGTTSVVCNTGYTGSGSVVLANSPTLITPNLGTPSAVVLTNATGTAASLNIGGTAATLQYQGVQAVNLGTGLVQGVQMGGVYNNGYPTTYGNILTLYGSGAGQLLVGWSGTTGGTADNYIRSLRDAAVGTNNWSTWAKIITDQNYNTVAPGLTGTGASGTWGISITGNAATVTTNANLTGPITSVGNATSIASQTGSGTTFVMSASPTISGPTFSGTVSGGAFSGGTWNGGTIGIGYGGTNATSQTSNGVAYYDGSKITTGSGFVYNGGSVGIGTTAPVSLLQVGSPAATQYAPSLTWGSPANVSLFASGQSLTFTLGNASPWAASIQSSSSSNLALPLSLNPLGGNVGIGTTSPDVPLFVAGTANQQLHVGGTNTSQRLELGYDTTSNYGRVQAMYNGTSAEPLVLNPSGGNVGIGMTGPVTALDVNGVVRSSAANNSTFRLYNPSSGTDQKNVEWTQYDTTGTLHGRFTNDAYSQANDFMDVYRNSGTYTTQYVVFPNGNVGIGTASPNALLHVFGAGNVNASLTYSGAASQILNSGSEDLAFGVSTSAPWAYWMQVRTNSNAANALAINPLGGNVGINNTSPGYNLDVSGTGHFSGALTVGGQIYGSAQYTLINNSTTNGSWTWSGQGGQPAWLWGSNDGANMYVWNPSNFSVNYANSAGSATTATSVPDRSMGVMTGRTEISGLYGYGTYGDANAPTYYMTAMGFGNGSYSGEIALNWLSSSGGMWYRTARDCCTNWTGWTQLVDTANVGTYALPIGGGTLTGNLSFSAANPYIISGGSWVGFPYGIYAYGGTNYFGTIAEFRGAIANDNAAYLQINGGTSGYTYFNGNVGIGMTNPSVPLEVGGAAATPTYSTSNSFNPSGAIFAVHDTTGANGLTVGVYTSANSYATWLQSGFQGNIVAPYNMVLNPFGGNVGIGTTAPVNLLTAGSSPGAQLDSNEIFQFGKTSGTVTYGTIRSAANTLYLGTQDGGSGTFIGSQTNTNFAIRTNANDRVTINASGNVGIGTTSPVSLLQVGSPAATQYAPSLTWGSPANVSLFASAQSLTFTLGNASPWAASIQSSSSSNLALPLSLNPLGGNVGIGTTSPDVPLFVASTASNQQLHVGGTNTSQRLELGYDTTSNYGRVQAMYNGTSTEPLVLNPSGGNVGIGTTVPQQLFHVYGGNTRLQYGASSTGNEFLSLYPTDFSSTVPYLFMKPSFGGTWNIGLWNGSAIYGTLSFQASTAAFAGNVGIGSTSPVNTLDVTGTGIHLASGTPGATAYQLYNVGGNLYWNGSQLASGSGSIGTGSQYQMAYFSGANTVAGDASIETDSNNDLIVTTGNLGLGSTSPSFQIDARRTSTTTANILIDDGSFQLTAAPTSASSATFRGVDGEVYYSGTANSPSANLTGVFGVAQATSGGAYTPGTIYGGQFQGDDSAPGTIASAYGINAQINNYSSGTITNATVAYLNMSNSGTIGTAWGLYIDQIYGATTYGLYQANSSNQNYFAGKVGIGSSSPVNTLDVSGTGIHLANGTPSATAYQLYNVGGVLYWNGSTVASGSGMTYPGTGIPQSTGSAWGTSITPGTGVVTALGNAVNASGGLVTYSGALGTPASGLATNLTGTASGLTAGSVSTISGLISAGTNVTISGSGTAASPYSISASAGGGSGTVSSGTQYQMAYYAASGTAVSGDSSIKTDSNNDLLITTGKVGIGTTPSYPLDVFGQIRSNNVVVANGGLTNFLARTPGAAQGEQSAYTLYSTFQNTSDNGPRRTADIIGGFNGGAWGKEFLSFNVGYGGSANDSANITLEKMRIQSNGNVGIGTTAPATELHTYYSGTPSVPLAKLEMSGGTSTASTGDMLLFTVDASGSGDRAGITYDLSTGNTGNSSARIVAIDDGNYGGHIVFESNKTCAFSTSTTENMRIQSNGYVGIGTNIPLYPLSLYINDANAGDPGITSINANSTGEAAIYGINDGGQFAGVGAYGSAYGNGFANNGGVYSTKSLIVFSDAATSTGGTDPIIFRAGGYISSTEKMRIQSNGNVGIGTTAPSYLLHVGSASASGIVLKIQNSSGYCTMNPITTTWSCTSDARMKKDIVNTASALPLIDKMRIRDFTMLSDGSRRTGVIAQEMLPDFPDMVHKDTDGYYTVDAPNPWMIVKALQELKAKNDNVSTESSSQKIEIKADTAEIENLKKENEKLKAEVKAANDNHTADEIRLKKLEDRLAVLTAAGGKK